MAQVKNLPASAGDVRDVGAILGREDPLEEELATHLFLAVLGLCCCIGAFFLVVARRGYSLVAVRRLLFTVASLVVI